jgi:hypothetical protein
MSDAWQPIETAPRDGTWFVTVSFAGEYEVGCYRPLIHFNYEPVEDNLYRRSEYIAYPWFGFNNFHRAIAWMPLPPPPEGARDE